MTSEAQAFAVAAHGDQRYGGRPYREHLAAMVGVLHDFGYVGAYEAAGWLHDVVEDTPVDLATLADRIANVEAAPVGSEHGAR